MTSPPNNHNTKTTKNVVSDVTIVLDKDSLTLWFTIVYKILFLKILYFP